MAPKQLRNPALWLALVAILSGCHSPSPPDTPTPAANTTQNDTYQAALDVLDRMHFRIAIADPNQGFIQTEPLAGAQWFEFWRQDNANFAAFNEANLHSIRRFAQVQIEQEQHPPTITCQVYIQRLSVPSQPVTGSSQGYRILTESDPFIQYPRFSPEQQNAMAWIDLGEDPALAQRLRKRIEKRITP
ncbi:hypothetical protein ACFL6U_08130 [Planctomycetota bacterium]